MGESFRAQGLEGLVLEETNLAEAAELISGGLSVESAFDGIAKVEAWLNTVLTELAFNLGKAGLAFGNDIDVTEADRTEDYSDGRNGHILVYDTKVAAYSDDDLGHCEITEIDRDALQTVLETLLEHLE